jgi:NAD+ kinase
LHPALNVAMDRDASVITRQTWLYLFMTPQNAAGSRLHFTASQKPEAQSTLRRMRALYGDCGEADAEVIIALGGDGHMLDVLRARMADGKPVYGLNRGTVGFLMNDFHEAALHERLERAEPVVIRPLRMRATDLSGATHERLAINEVSLIRQSNQTAHLRIHVDGKERMPELACDGVIVATPAGSTAYNLSAHGPIVPIGSNLLALTPISAFRPRRWRGALLSNRAKVRLEVIDAERRGVAATADSQEVRNVVRVDVEEDPSRRLTMLFDEGRALDERILVEQFST